MNTDVQRRILRDMSDGIFLLSAAGSVEMTNPKLCEILSIPKEKLEGRPFGSLFFYTEENDEFCQMILDAVANKQAVNQRAVPYRSPQGEKKFLYVTTSYLEDWTEHKGVIALVADITEQAQMHEELKKRKEQIDELLDSLVRTLATAIDERSHYTANHTQNIVRYSNRFLDYLERTGDPHAFDPDQRRAFIMSAWLHDVGKLVVPLEIMDKADRLGPMHADIYERFRVMGLLDEIALLKGEIDQQTLEENSRAREKAMELIDKVNCEGFVPDEDLAAVEELAERTFIDEHGVECHWITEEECTSLFIRKGTLTEEERSIMQMHASYTAKILQGVSFPEGFEQVPMWAASHHELLNGKGYPQQLSGDDIPMEVRLLTIMDIFEALTARDRPYKKPLSVERSLDILHSMAEEGSIDGELLELFEKSRAWEEEEETTPAE